MQGKLALAVTLNLVFVGVELAYGFIANSVALIADAGHNLSDVLGLAATLVAAILATRPASGRFTYGMRRASVLAALGNAVLLLFTSGAIAWEAVQRLLEPQAVGGGIVMVVAALGMIISGGSAWLLGGHAHAHDLNIRSAFLHMVGDAVVSAGVVLSGLIILRTGWTWVDPLSASSWSRPSSWVPGACYAMRCIYPWMRFRAVSICRKCTPTSRPAAALPKFMTCTSGG